MSQPPAPLPDKTYAQEAALSVGRWFANVYRGMLEGGIPRGEAIRLMISYVAAFVTAKPSDPESKEK